MSERLELKRDAEELGARLIVAVVDSILKMHLNSQAVLRPLFAAGLLESATRVSVSSFLAPSYVSLFRKLPYPSRNKLLRQRRFASTDVSSESTAIPQHLVSPGPRLPDEHRSQNVTEQYTGAGSDPMSWIDLLEAMLPLELRAKPVTEVHCPSDTLDPIELGRMLAWARRTHQIDVLHHLGVTLGRWQAVLWIVRHIPNVELLNDEIYRPIKEGNQLWTDFVPFKDLLQNPVHLSYSAASSGGEHQASTQSEQSSVSMHAFTQWHGDAFKDEREITLRTALGEIWQSLGNMILTAAEVDAEASQIIMSNVLQIIAHLHHVGSIQPSVYHYNPSHDTSVLQQPPTLHLLSSKILNALSDATLDARQPPYASQVDWVKTQYGTGGIIFPGARYKRKRFDLGPEVWLELVLWSCVHGQWLMEGAKILSQLKKRSGNQRWKLVSWRQILEGQGPQDHAAPPIVWDDLRSKLHANAPTLPNQGSDRSIVEKTVSSEVVVALIDGLVNTIRVGLGSRGNAPSPVIEQIIRLKELLRRDQLNLGASTWNAVVVRLLEAEGINVEGDPTLVEWILSLTPGYGAELNSRSTSSGALKEDLIPDYIFEASAAPLAIYHRLLQAFSDRGDVNSALRAFRGLHNLIDSNKRKSLEDFFDEIKFVNNHKEPGGRINFESRLSRIDFPGFHYQIPSSVLASLLVLVTKTERYDFGRWLLYTNEIDGPIISELMYADPHLAGAILSFASSTNDKGLLLKVTNALKDPTRTDNYSSNGDLIQLQVTEQQRSNIVPAIILLSLRSQVKRGSWVGVEEILNFIKELPEYKWTPTSIAEFIRDLIRYGTPFLGQRSVPPASAEKVKYIIARLRLGDLGALGTHGLAQLDSILGVFSSVNKRLAQFCSDLISEDRTIPLDLPTEAFNSVLEGVVDQLGDAQGKKLWDIWCEDLESPASVYNVIEGGIKQNPKYLRDKDRNFVHTPEKVVLESAHERNLEYRGCVSPNVRTVKIIVRDALRVSQDYPRSREPVPFPLMTSAMEAEQPRQHEFFLNRAPKPNAGDEAAADSDAPGLSNTQRRELLEWATSTLLNMRIDPNDIDKELNGHLSRSGTLAGLVQKYTEWRSLTEPIAEEADNDISIAFDLSREGLDANMSNVLDEVPLSSGLETERAAADD